MFYSHSSPMLPLTIFPPFRLQISPWGAKWLTLRNTKIDDHKMQRLMVFRASLRRYRNDADDFLSITVKTY